MAMFVQLLGMKRSATTLTRAVLNDNLHVHLTDTLPEGTIPMRQTWPGDSAFRIEPGEGKSLIDPFLSDNPSRDRWSDYLTGKNSTKGGDR